MTKEIMKLIKHKNTTYKTYIAHKINKSDYVTCRSTSNTIRNAKTNYHKNLLTNPSNNTNKLLILVAK